MAVPVAVAMTVVVAAVIVSAVVFVELGWVKGVIIIVFFLLYQQLENHILQPVIYGRTVQLSPLVVLISVLIGAELAGLYARAAVLCSGLLPAKVDEDFSLNYGDVTPEFAQALVDKLMS